MSIGDWDIFDELARLRRDLDRFAARRLPTAELLDQEHVWAPPVDIRELPEVLVLLVDLPGVRREGIELKVRLDSITLEGVRADAEGGADLRRERPSGRFRRSFRIGMPIDPSGARAVYREGVLRISIPRAAPSGPARVRVEVE